MASDDEPKAAPPIDTTGVVIWYDSEGDIKEVSQHGRLLSHADKFKRGLVAYHRRVTGEEAGRAYYVWQAARCRTFAWMANDPTHSATFTRIIERVKAAGAWIEPTGEDAPCQS